MSGSAKRSITVSLDGSNKSSSLPLIDGTIGPSVADIRKLYGDLGIFTYDPGYGATASCESKITYIDGDEGVLLYRGYPIEQLAEKSNFLEICYLLLNGELPNAKEREEFDLGVMRHTMLHEQLRTFYNGFRRDAHPMAVMCGVVGALSAFYHDSLDIHDPGEPPHQRVPTDRQGADDRRLGAQILDRPAVHVSAQRSLVRGELPLHVPRACRPNSGRPIRCCHARWT